MLKQMNNSLKRAVKLVHVRQDLKDVGYHFNHYFKSIIAQSEEELIGAHRIRHEVFCQELGLFTPQGDGLERDDYDDFSEQCLIQHRSSQDYTSVMRLILPRGSDDILPIEKIASPHITNTALAPDKFERTAIAEISRIAISPHYRRRNMDQFVGAAQGGIDPAVYCEEEMRCFPFMAIGLYMAAAARLLNGGKQHAYFMIEPFMARSLKFVGVPIICIGDEFDYVGKRRPYYVDSKSFVRNIKPSLQHMFEEFLREDQLKRSMSK